MIRSPQQIRVARDGVEAEAEIAWRAQGAFWVVSIRSAAFDSVEAEARDAFEALCAVRDQLEPRGWRIGVLGAQPDVWPSGMARSQGGGLRAYRMTPEQVGGLVDTFEPVDPATVVTVAQQRAETDRLYDVIRASHGPRQ